MFLLKLTSILSILTIFASSSIYAQDSDVGIKGGLNLSNFHTTNDDVDDNNLRVGYNAGLYFKAALSDVFAIQPEILYTTKGAKSQYDLGLLGDGEIEQRFSYIQIPVLGVITLFDAVSVHAGPYLGYMLNAEVENNADNNSFDFTENLDEGDYERLEYGLSIGAGVNIETLTLGARYDYGLSEIGKDQSFNFNGSEQSSDFLKNSKNSVFQIYAGISF